MTLQHPMCPPTAEIIEFAAVKLFARRSATIKTSTRVGEDIGDDLPAEIALGRTGRPLPEPQTETCKNQRLRDARKAAWNDARHTTDYWRARMKWNSALSTAQDWNVADSNTYAKNDHKEHWRLVDLWRTALVKQLLTPAPDLGAVTWKRTQLTDEQYVHVGVKRERIELAITTDAEWLAAHPTKRSIAATRKPNPEQQQ